MRAATVKYVHDRVKAAVPATADFYDAAQQVKLDAHLQNRRAWVKLYMPSEEGEGDVTESYLVTIDCGAIALETARDVAEQVRSQLANTRRDPDFFRRLRITPLNEGNFHRVQLTYRMQRPSP